MSKYSLLQYPKNPKVGPNWSTRRDPLRFLIHSVANHQKIDHLVEKKLWKNLYNAEKTERGDHLGFLNIHSVAKLQKKLKGDPLGNFFSNKSLAMPKN